MAEVIVDVTKDAYELLCLSGREAAQFPQALQEAFREAGISLTVSLDVAKKSGYFVTSNPDELLLVTTFRPAHKIPHTIPSYLYLKHLTNVSDIQEVRIGGRHGFHAYNTAVEFVRLYKQYYQVA